MTSLASRQPLESDVIDRIRVGDWSYAILSGDPDSRAQLCTQLLRSLCVIDPTHGFADPDVFGQNMARCIQSCAAAAKNTSVETVAEAVVIDENEGEARVESNVEVEISTDPDSMAVHTHIATALVETIWSLCIEWEPDTSDDSASRWKEEQDSYLEQTKRLVRLTRAMLSQGVISHDMAKERLDPDFLEQIGAIQSATTFTRKYIRLNTALNFKQTKFNLVSEQSEGFSKLVTLIQASMSGISPNRIGSDIVDYVAQNPDIESPQGSVVLQALRSLPDLHNRIQNLLTDIKRLIGVFNIDPNRVLDIIIDCFMASVRFYWVFYIALLDASPWCRIPAESKKVAQLVGWKLQLYANGPASDRKFTDELLTVAALLIKHRLIRLSDIFAMLAPKSIDDIDKEFEAWLAKRKEEQGMGMGMGMGASLGGSGGNLLSMMGGLEDSGEEGEEQSADADSSNPDVADEWSNQHSLLCAKLLSMGDTENGLVYLKRFPDMARTHDSIADLAARIIDASTTSIYQKTDCVKVSSKTQIQLRTTIDMSNSESKLSTNAWGFPVSATDTEAPEHHTSHPHASYVLSPIFKRPSEKFFYESFWLLDSKTQMPQIDSLSILPRVLAPWLNIAFLRLHRLPSLLTRLIRLCRYGLTQGANEGQSGSDQQEMWLGFLRAWILPAFSLGTPSAGLSNELWLLISPLSISQRYAIYKEWDSVLSSGKPLLPYIEGADRTTKPQQMDMSMSMDMSLDDALDDDDLDSAMESQPAATYKSYVEIESLYDTTRRQVRSVMRRLSGDTVKLMGRQLCSLCHPTPTVSLKIILDQVCSYDNLVDSVVEAFRYLTPLDADVMFYVILKILSDPSSARTKDDGVNAAHWLQCLSTFVAAFSHRHENQRLDIVLDYVLKLTVNMARAEDHPPVFELTILSDAISRLAGIPFMANATEDQVMALQGGHYLRLEAFSMVSPWVLPQNATAETAIAASTDNRLTRRMAQWLTSLVVNRGQALSFAVSLCVHAEKTLKMVTLPLSNMLVIYDREVERVYQLFNLLHSNLRPEKYTKLIPGPHVLVSKYNLSWELAILWGRPSISLHLVQGLKQWEEDGEVVKVEVVEKDSGDPKADIQAAAASGTVAGEAGNDTQMEVDAAEAPVDPEAPRVVSDLRFDVPLLPRDYVDYFSQQSSLSASETSLSPEFVAVFWALTLYDIEIPVDRYKKDIDTQNALIKRIDAMTKQSSSRSKNTMLSQMRARAALTIDGLEKEMQDQKQHVSRIRRWLIAQKDYWFCMSNGQRKLVSKALIQHCVLPRAVLSASDAYFCAKMLWMMHFPLATNKFSLMIVCDNIFGDNISTLMASCTENEARNYAKFLNATLSYLSPLHQSEACYNERGINRWRGLVGFQQQWPYERGYLPPKSRTVRQQMPTNPDPDSGDARRILSGNMMPYDDFRTVMRKWQITLTKAFLNVLDSERNDTVRNGILALKEMQKSFPIIAQYGRRIMEKVANIAKSEDTSGAKDAAGGSESNKNLKVMATSYGAYLAMAKKTWVTESDYYPAPPKTAARTQRSASGQQSSKKQEPRTQPSETAPVAGTVTTAGAETKAAATLSATTAAAAPTEASNISGVAGAKDPKSNDKGTSGADHHASSSAVEKPRPMAAVSRSVSSSNLVAAAAAAAAAASAATPSNGAANTSPGSRAATSSATAASSEGDKKRGREHESRRHRDKDSSSTRNRDREKERLRSEGVDRRENRSSRSSPMHQDSNAAYSEPRRRSRENIASESRNESARQRINTPSKASSQLKSPNLAELRISTPQQSSPHANAQAPLKPSAEEADRKKRELRAQLLKQQEEKQKQKTERLHPESASDRHDRDRDRTGRHSSRESSIARDSGVHSDRSKGEDREDRGGGRRQSRRVVGRNADFAAGPGQAQPTQVAGAHDKSDRRQQQQQQHAGVSSHALDDSGSYDRARNALHPDRQQQLQQQPRKRPQQYPDQAPQGAGRSDHGKGGDHGQRRNGRGSGGGSGNGGNNQAGASLRGTGGRQANQNRDRPSEAVSQPGRKSFSRDHPVSDGGSNARRGPKRGRGNDSSRDWDDGKRHRK
ncbi:THO2 plays a role in transcriptional elongation [Coemansia sp. RSA 485]|nr:THO2 plays a role in transcriptional elongation [Coemansia sp. RSA 485]